MTIVGDYSDVAETLLDHVEHGRTDQAEDLMRIPARGYHDPDCWNNEMDRIFKRLPLMLALSIELPAPGDYKAMDVLDVPVLITRLKDGSVRAMMRVCTHRANLVAKEGRGNCSRFSCPYHGWTYANDGRLMAVTDPAKFGPLDKAERGLTQLPCAERGGMIFVILTPGLAIDIEGFLGGMLPDLERFNFQDWHYCGNREIFGANWKVSFDGYLEGYHFAMAHPQTIHPRTFSNVMKFDAFGPHLRVAFPQTEIQQKLAAVPRAEWGRQENNGYDFVRVLFPNTPIFVAPEITQIAQLLPGPLPGQNRTILHFISRKAPTNDEETAALENMMNFLRNVVNDEDYVMGLSVQKGLESGAVADVVFGRNEPGNQYFHKWLDYYLQNDPDAPQPTF